MIICFIAGLAFLIVGGFTLWNAAGADSGACAWPPAQAVPALVPGVLAATDSTAFAYSPGWQVSAGGAHPPEPPDPFAAPAGVVTFSYTGSDLYLLLQPGDYWAYLYVTVDGQPANRLPALGLDSTGAPAGYKPLLAPERAGSAALPVLVHQDGAAAVHAARIEVWRGWGQTPLRGVAIDPPWMTGAACAGRPIWPAVLLVALGVWNLAAGAWLHFQEEGGLPGGGGSSRRRGAAPLGSSPNWAWRWPPPAWRCKPGGCACPASACWRWRVCCARCTGWVRCSLGCLLPLASSCHCSPTAPLT